MLFLVSVKPGYAVLNAVLSCLKKITGRCAARRRTRAVAAQHSQVHGNPSLSKSAIMIPFQAIIVQYIFRMQKPGCFHTPSIRQKPNRFLTSSALAYWSNSRAVLPAVRSRKECFPDGKHPPARHRHARRFPVCRRQNCRSRSASSPGKIKTGVLSHPGGYELFMHAPVSKRQRPFIPPAPADPDCRPCAGTAHWYARFRY